MKSLTLPVAAVLVLLAGCASQPCEEVQSYQQTVPRSPLTVPDDLSEPRVRSRSPAVEPGAATRRADGRCLEEPPAFGTAGADAADAAD